jgi:putative flippase GtrA
MTRLLKEAIGYGAASVCALAVDMAVLTVLVHYFSWWYLAAATVSFTVGMAVAYGISVKFVFKHRRLEDARSEFLSFAALGAIGLAVNALVMMVAVKFGGLHYLLAKCVAAAFTFVCNFVTRRQLLFVQRLSTQGRSPQHGQQ